MPIFLCCRNATVVGIQLSIIACGLYSFAYNSASVLILGVCDGTEYEQQMVRGLSGSAYNVFASLLRQHVCTSAATAMRKC